MAKAKYWKLPGGRYGGITARGKRFIVDSLAKARAKLGKKRKSKSSRSSNPKGKTKVAIRRRNPRRRRSRKMTIPLAPIGGLLATPALRYALGELARGNWEVAIRQPARFAGIDPATGNFTVTELQNNLLPIIIGCLVHKFVGGAPLNLNRVLSRANVPFIRI